MLNFTELGLQPQEAAVLLREVYDCGALVLCFRVLTSMCSFYRQRERFPAKLSISRCRAICFGTLFGRRTAAVVPMSHYLHFAGVEKSWLHNHILQVCYFVEVCDVR